MPNGNQPAGEPKPFTIDASALSERGRREENQDRMARFSSRFGEVMLVTDGMGGHKGGATAAEMVVRYFPDALKNAPPEASLPEALQHAVQLANSEIYKAGHSGDPTVSGMGATVVIAVIRDSESGPQLIAANAGDSRAYLYREGRLQQVTKDHTAVQRMIDAGLLSEAEARNHPESSVLTRALGQQTEVAVEVYAPVPLQHGDHVLLCSDGLSGFAPADDIARTMNTAAEKRVRALADLAYKNGSDDNVTIQVARIAKPALPPVPPPVVARSRTVLMAAAGALLAVALFVWFKYWLPQPATKNKELVVTNPLPVEKKDPVSKAEPAKKKNEAKKKKEQKEKKSESGTPEEEKSEEDKETTDREEGAKPEPAPSTTAEEEGEERKTPGVMQRTIGRVRGVIPGLGNREKGKDKEKDKDKDREKDGDRKEVKKEDRKEEVGKSREEHEDQ